jgi:hypothetical protein
MIDKTMYLYVLFGRPGSPQAKFNRASRHKHQLNNTAPATRVATPEVFVWTYYVRENITDTKFNL